MSSEQNLLAPYGFHAGDEAVFLQNLSPEAADIHLKSQFESIAAEVLLNESVSPAYHYLLDPQGNMTLCDEHGNALSDTPIAVNPWERNGYVALGMQHISHALLNNPGRVVVQYSPAGPTVFDGEPCVVDVIDPRFHAREDDFAELRPYQEGQMYVQYFDGTKVTGVAIKAGNELIAEDVMATLGIPKYRTVDETARIKYYLLHPVATTMQPDGFAELLGTQSPGGVLFADKDGNSYTTSDVATRVADTFNGVASRPGMIFAKGALEYIHQYGPVETWTPNIVKNAYLSMAVNFAEMNGLDRVSFEGGCGGMEQWVIDLMYDMGYTGQGGGSLHNMSDMYSLNYRTAVVLTTDDIAVRFKPETGYTGPWEPGRCRKKGGCGQWKEKVGKCEICFDCQKIYDAGGVPSPNSAKNSEKAA